MIKNALCVLIVDDSQPQATYLANIIKSNFGENIFIDVVLSGLQAIEYVKVRKYDYIFMDIIMPVLDGMETSKRIRKIDSYPYIMAYTSADRNSFLTMNLSSCGIDSIASKPLDISFLERLFHLPALQI